jgi:hypothetical protein
MTTKFRIKLGALEVDYEGNEEFSKTDLMALLQELNTIQKLTPKKEEHKDEDTGSVNGKPTEVGVLSTSEIAQKLSVTSGPELAMAAAAKAIIVDKQDTVTRKALLASMQSATAYYKNTYSGNLGQTLKRLVLDSKLNEVGTNTYGLNADARKDLVTRLALSS